MSLVGIGHWICAKLLAKVYCKHFPIEVCLFGLGRLSAMQIIGDDTDKFILEAIIHKVVAIVRFFWAADSILYSIMQIFLHGGVNYLQRRHFSMNHKKLFSFLDQGFIG